MTNTNSVLPLDIPIVAIGASAGGLEAFETFFAHMPMDSGMAFILLAHLSPDHASILPDLIQKRTSMQVQACSENMRVSANQVYVIPPNKRLSIKNGYLRLQELGEHRSSHLLIDSFFTDFAEDQGKNGICIVLSGTGHDGSLGITNAAGRIGLIMAQDEDSAKFQGMPASAMATGLVDHIMSPDKMPAQLVDFISHKSTDLVTKDSVPLIKQAQPLNKIYSLLQASSGHDFSLYKKNTLHRRIERRMHLHQLDDFNQYIALLENSRNELNTLFKELLIGVTQFFRDPLVFKQLRDEHLPKLLKSKQQKDHIRAWVTGCSTGEEAYSLAIVLDESIKQMDQHFVVQIFATDLDEDAIDFARKGLYPQSISEKVSPERLKLHFHQEDDGQFRVKKSLREKIIFATHNLIQDPPFTKLDILSCRNLLIYFGSQLQNKLFPYFHYSLKLNGLLVLGSSETIGQHLNLFKVLDKKNKIFKRITASTGIPRSLSLYAPSKASQSGTNTMSLDTKTDHELNALQLVETLLEQSEMQPCAIIDEEYNIVYVHGRTGQYLEAAQGKMSVNILEMAKPGLKTGLAKALRDLTNTQQETTIKDLQLREYNNEIIADVTLKPIFRHERSSELIMVTFSEKSKSNLKGKNAATNHKNKSVSELEYELQVTRNTLQATIEELETTNEELKSSNEELQSTNEELQSTNEEIETSKEELQSLNEESSSVNTELQSRIDELSKSNDDIKNLLDSTQIATLFLDVELAVRRFTPRLKSIIPLSESDAGRPIQHFATSLIDVDLVKFSNKVLDDLAVLELQVSGKEQTTYIMKVRPYRTLNNVIDGVVITFEDITERQVINEALRESEIRYRMLFELANDSIVMIEPQTGRFIEANRFAYEQLGFSREEFLSLCLNDVIVEQKQSTVLEKIENNIINASDVLILKQKSKDGKILKAAIKAQPVDLGNKRFIMSTWHYQ